MCVTTIATETGNLITQVYIILIYLGSPKSMRFYAVISLICWVYSRIKHLWKMLFYNQS